MKPQIFVSHTDEGNILAFAHADMFRGAPSWLVIEPLLGKIIDSNTVQGTNIFRWLVTEARKYQSHPDRRMCS